MADFGAANTNTFMLGEATVMIGLPADLYKMTPSTHGIGLVKNFQVLGENFNPRNAALRRRTTARSRGPAHRSGDSTTHLPQGPTPLVALL